MPVTPGSLQFSAGGPCNTFIWDRHTFGQTNATWPHLSQQNAVYCIHGIIPRRLSLAQNGKYDNIQCHPIYSCYNWCAQYSIQTHHIYLSRSTSLITNPLKKSTSTRKKHPPFFFLLPFFFFGDFQKNHAYPPNKQKPSTDQGKFQGPPPNCGLLDSHTTPIRIPGSMGMVWVPRTWERGSPQLRGAWKKWKNIPNWRTLKALSQKSWDLWNLEVWLEERGEQLKSHWGGNKELTPTKSSVFFWISKKIF